MTLTEVMISTALLMLVAGGLASSYILNMRLARAHACRTHAVNTALGMVEQIRAMGYAELRDIYFTPSNPQPVPFQFVDPVQTTVQPTGYSRVDVPFNNRAGTVLVSTWTEVLVPLDNDPAVPGLPMRYWMRLDRDSGTTLPTSGALDSTSIHAMMQVTLFYEWQVPGAASNRWIGGDLRVAIPKLTVGALDI